MKFDFQVHEGSRLAGLHPALQPLGVAARETVRAWKGLWAGQLIRMPRSKYAAYRHRSDGMMTKHNDDFMETERFRKAYARSVEVAGADYNIPWRIHQALWCADLARRRQGDIVEFGTACGGIMSAVLAAWDGWNQSGKSMWLVDTFEPFHINPATGKQDKTQPVHPNYAKSFETTKANFAGYDSVHFVKGYVPDCLDQMRAETISFVHIDMNIAEPEVAALRHCWDRIVSGGVVLLDDYGYGSGTRHETRPGLAHRIAQYRKMNELARELGVEILSTPTGQGILVK